jgi:hypothetical protein
MQAKDVDKEAQKILSFTDNRQDASLQAGHFNDFVQVGLLRNAIYRALPDRSYLRHQDIASEVVKALNLPPEVYAQNPGQIGVQPRINQEALTAFIEYNLYCDLRRGWRIVQPNLEQCGLLKIEYEGLKDVCVTDSYWQEDPILAQAPGEMRFEVAKALLDHLRKSLALDAHCLRAESQIRLKSQVNASLKDLWAFDADERLVEGEWFRYGKEIEGRFSLAAISLLGRYLRSTRAWQFLERPLNQEQYELLLRAFVRVLTDGGYLKFEEAGDNFRIQLSVVTLQWKKGDGIAPPADSVRMVHLKSTTTPSRQNDTNVFFTKFYQEMAASLYAYEGREHTGQTARDDRIEREEQFKSGTLSTLFCSPTMELGIDISDLVAVNMRNVPPS